jgi:hypothetical protein
MIPANISGWGRVRRFQTDGVHFQTDGCYGLVPSQEPAALLRCDPRLPFLMPRLSCSGFSGMPPPVRYASLGT